MKFLKLLVLLGNIKGDNLKRFELRIQKLFNTTHPENDAAFFQISAPQVHRFLHISKCTLQEVYPSRKNKRRKSKRRIIKDGCVSDKENLTILNSKPRVIDQIKTDRFGILLSKYSNNTSQDIKLKFHCQVMACDFEESLEYNSGCHLKLDCPSVDRYRNLVRYGSLLKLWRQVPSENPRQTANLVFKLSLKKFYDEKSKFSG